MKKRFLILLVSVGFIPLLQCSEDSFIKFKKIKANFTYVELPKNNNIVEFWLKVVSTSTEPQRCKDLNGIVFLKLKKAGHDDLIVGKAQLSFYSKRRGSPEKKVYNEFNLPYGFNEKLSLLTNVWVCLRIHNIPQWLESVITKHYSNIRTKGCEHFKEIKNPEAFYTLTFEPDNKSCTFGNPPDCNKQGTYITFNKCYKQNCPHKFILWFRFCGIEPNQKKIIRYTYNSPQLDPSIKFQDDIKALNEAFTTLNFNAEVIPNLPKDFYSVISMQMFLNGYGIMLPDDIYNRTRHVLNQLKISGLTNPLVNEFADSPFVYISLCTALNYSLKIVCPHDNQVKSYAPLSTINSGILLLGKLAHNELIFFPTRAKIAQITVNQEEATDNELIVLGEKESNLNPKEYNEKVRKRSFNDSLKSDELYVEIANLIEKVPRSEDKFRLSELLAKLNNAEKEKPKLELYHQIYDLLKIHLDAQDQDKLKKMSISLKSSV